MIRCNNCRQKAKKYLQTRNDDKTLSENVYCSIECMKKDNKITEWTEGEE